MGRLGIESASSVSFDFRPLTCDTSGMPLESQCAQQNEVFRCSRRLFVGKMPSLNELVEARGRVKGEWNGYNALKSSMEELVAVRARAQGFKPVRCGRFSYVFHEKNRKRDPSNVASGAIKLIEDALVKSDLLEDDGPDNILGIDVRFEYGSATPGVMLTVENAVFWEKEKELNVGRANAGSEGRKANAARPGRARAGEKRDEAAGAAPGKAAAEGPANAGGDLHRFIGRGHADGGRKARRPAAGAARGRRS